MILENIILQHCYSNVTKYYDNIILLYVCVSYFAYRYATKSNLYN